MQTTYQLRTLFDVHRKSELNVQLSVPLSQGVAGETMRERAVRRLTREDAPQATGPQGVDADLWGDTTQSVLSLPLEAYSQMLGALTFASSRADAYGRDDIRIAATVATLLAHAIERAHQVAALKSANDELARSGLVPRDKSRASHGD